VRLYAPGVVVINVVRSTDVVVSSTLVVVGCGVVCTVVVLRLVVSSIAVVITVFRSASLETNFIRNTSRKIQ